MIKKILSVINTGRKSVEPKLLNKINEQIKLSLLNADGMLLACRIFSWFDYRKKMLPVPFTH